MHNSADVALRERAQKVIPGGMWGHMNATRLPAAYPQYFSRAQGCHLWDIEGREYIDFMCAYGPMILGYNDADVNRAADAQRAEGDIFNGPSARLVELAEVMVGTVTHGTQEQLQGISQINEAVSHMDTLTQRNAQMVDQVASSAFELQERAKALTDTVQLFHVNSGDIERLGDAVALRKAAKG